MSDVAVIEVIIPAPVATVEMVVGLQGPPGPSSTFLYHESQAVIDGVQVITASAAVISINATYINGLRQPMGLVTFFGTTITVPSSLNVIAGDYVTVIYS